MDEWRPIAVENEPLADAGSSTATNRLVESVRRLRATVGWFGPGRILAALVTFPLIGLGSYMLVRTPPTPTESSIAYVSSLAPGSVSTSAGTEIGVGAHPGSSPTARSSASSETIVVHVAGHVYSPGVYRLDVGQRIVDAIRAAGGAQPIADLDSINLALAVEDGDQVYVPAVGESRTPAVTGRVGAGSSQADAVFPVNINTAEASTLEELPGIGPSTAAAIIGHRNEVGPFVSPSDLLDVPGIGAAKFEAIKDLVTT